MQATVVIFPGSKADAELARTLRDVVQGDEGGRAIFEAVVRSAAERAGAAS